MEQSAVEQFIRQKLPIEARPYQIKIITDTVNSFLGENLKSVMIESPTGSGKSLMGLIICRLLQEIDPGLTFGWVAMRRKLLQQAAIENNERVGVKNIDFVSMFDKNPPKKRVLICDEAQHDAASTMGGLHMAMGSELRLGLTATPFRTDRMKLSFERIIKDCGVTFLIEQGYLCKFNQFVIPKWTPKMVADRYLDNPAKWGKSIVYFYTEQRCREFISILQNNGIKSDVILGSDPLSRRDELLDRFEDGDLQVLANMNLLIEGFDMPSLQTVWVRDSGKLNTIQMAGRVLRKNPADKSKIANIVQSEETWFPYTKVTKAVSEYVWQDDKWLTLAPGPQIERISNMVRERLFAIPVVLPSYLNGSGFNIRVTSKGKVSKQNRKKERQNISRNGFDDNPL